MLQVMAYGEEPDGPSAAIAAFDATRNMIQVQFNSPEDAASLDVDYKHTIDVSLREPLRVAKAKIAE